MGKVKAKQMEMLKAKPKDLLKDLQMETQMGNHSVRPTVKRMLKGLTMDCQMERPREMGLAKLKETQRD